MRYNIEPSPNTTSLTTNYQTEQQPLPSLQNIKYPEISLDFLDIYVYTNRGDRYDLLANSYYGDYSLWWIISRANPNFTQDSLMPPIGSQIRIPNKSRVGDILSAYKNLNT